MLCCYKFQFFSDAVKAHSSPVHLSVHRQSHVGCTGCRWRRKTQESFQRRRAGSVGVRSHAVRGRTLRPRRATQAARTRADLGRNPGAGQCRVQSAADPSGGEEALGRLEEAQRRQAGRRSSPQLLPAVQQGGLDARASLPAKPQASAVEAEAKHPTKA